MIYGVVLAGGVGRRMGNAEKPKQFMTIGGKPIIVHTVERFAVCSELEKVIVLTPEKWIDHTRNILAKHIPDMSRVVVIEGGDTRNETLMNSIRYIESEGNLDDDTIIITHDAVRPFVTYRIISENIKGAQEYGACDTVFPATDTIVRSDDGVVVSEIPDRSKLYQGQTPQSFKAKKLREIYEGLSEDEKAILTDAAKILVLKGEKVHLVMGESFNIKITYPYDIKVAETILKGDE
ncbi:MAG: 2-C-methyl-D-erythritol 4-phosphate cytidylyltransferase [Mogibacterium sp.]|nr:2-C-methyl-D-erythritol 4-phosphate cytidylyltransferase [Mogibacterium sp.]